MAISNHVCSHVLQHPLLNNYRLPNVTWIVAVGIYSIVRIVKQDTNHDIAQDISGQHFSNAYIQCHSGVMSSSWLFLFWTLCIIQSISRCANQPFLLLTDETVHCVSCWKGLPRTVNSSNHVFVHVLLNTRSLSMVLIALYVCTFNPNVECGKVRGKGWCQVARGCPVLWISVIMCLYIYTA